MNGSVQSIYEAEVGNWEIERERCERNRVKFTIAEEVQVRTCARGSCRCRRVNRADTAVREITCRGRYTPKKRGTINNICCT